MSAGSEEFYLDYSDRYSSLSDELIVQDEQTQPSNLPFDVLVEILVKLNYSEIKALCSTNVSHRAVCKDSEFWTTIIYRQFSNPEIIPALSMEDNYLLLAFHRNGEIYPGSERVVDIRTIFQSNIKDNDREYFVYRALDAGLNMAEIAAYILESGKRLIDFGIRDYDFDNIDLIQVAAENDFIRALAKVVDKYSDDEKISLFILMSGRANVNGIRNLFNIMVPVLNGRMDNFSFKILDVAFNEADKYGNADVARFLINKGARSGDTQMFKKYFSQ